jgi:histidinol-phosphate aminotransferase
LVKALAQLGFETLPSQTNFLFTKPPIIPAERWLAEFRERKILARWFNYPETRAYLRITVGTEREADALIKAATAVLQKASRSGAV